MKKTSTSGLRRIAALGLGLAMVGGLSLVAAAPASAASAATYTANGTGVGSGGVPVVGAQLTIDSGAPSVTDANGSFSVSVAPGPHDLAIAADGYVTLTPTLDMPSNDIDLGPYVLVANAPAAPATYSISGVVTAKDANPAFAPSITLTGIAGSSPFATRPDADGKFTFANLEPGADLSLLFSAEGYGTQTKAVPVTNANVDVTIELLPTLPVGTATATLTGDSTVGSTLSVKTTGWPEGTKLSYTWFWNGGNMGGEIPDATGTTYTVTSDVLGRLVGVFVTGTLPGFAPSDGVYSNLSATITAAQQPAAAAPVANSSDLAAFLAAKGVTPLTQTDAGLPAGALNPGTSYTANVAWTAADSFVDVYAFSTPVLVGSFPVVDGVAQIKLSPKVLGQLDAGAHTLVITGQSSGAVQAVSLSIAATLAETGANAAAPITAAVLLLLLGAALVVVRRRRRLHV